MIVTDAAKLSAGPAQSAMREALADLLLVVDPMTSRKIALAALRLAAAMVAIAGEIEAAGPRGGALEVLMMLAEGAPDVPAAA